MKYQSKNRISLRIFALLAVFLFSSQISLASEITPKNVIDLTNHSRIKNGLDVLAENSKLNEAAMEKARDMFQNDYFAHTSPQNVTPWFWFEKNDYDYQYAGENLAINFRNVEEEHEAWMESVDHRKNILNSKYQEIGVAVQKGMIENRPAIVTVQLFGSREDFNVVLGEAIKTEPVEVSARHQNSDGNVRWINIFQALGIMMILLVMAVNPIIVAIMFVRRKNREKGSADIAYPVKIILAK